MKKILLAITAALIITSCTKQQQEKIDYDNRTPDKMDEIYRNGGISVYKLKVDSVEYLLSTNYGDGISMIRVVK